MWHLRAIAEASARVRAAPDVRRMVDAIADEAERVFAVARVAVEAFDRADAPVRAERGSERAGDPPAISAPLEEDRAGLQGSIALAGPARGRFDVIDRLLLAQLARTTVSALEHAWLLRRATEASQARDEVLAVVSHDLRSPVSTVTLGARMLRASLEARGRDFDDDALIVRCIERACERMSRLIENLLDAAQLERGTLRVRLQPQDAAELVRAAVDAAAVSAEAARVAVRVGALEPLRVLADRERVLQVFSNLVGNALKVTPGGGAVTLSVTREGGDARFAVADAGPGVPAALRPTLFSRYARGPGGGHGLGLYISRHIVEAHGGRIDAHDGDGSGSVFTFTLPLAP